MATSRRRYRDRERPSQRPTVRVRHGDLGINPRLQGEGNGTRAASTIPHAHASDTRLTASQRRLQTTRRNVWADAFPLEEARSFRAQDDPGRYSLRHVERRPAILASGRSTETVPAKVLSTRSAKPRGQTPRESHGVTRTRRQRIAGVVVFLVLAGASAVLGFVLVRSGDSLVDAARGATTVAGRALPR
jgi:hypothetical protein